MNFKGFIDLYTEFAGDIIIYDWKNNSTHDYQTHIKQYFRKYISNVTASFLVSNNLNIFFLKSSFPISSIDSFNNLQEDIYFMSSRGKHLDDLTP